MSISVSRSLLFILAVLLTGYFLYSVDPVKAGITNAKVREFFVQDHKYSWHFTADSTFAPYLESYVISDNVSVAQLDVEICRHLDGKHYSSNEKFVNGIKHRDIYCQFEVAGHLTSALAASLQLR